MLSTKREQDDADNLEPALIRQGGGMVLVLSGDDLVARLVAGISTPRTLVVLRAGEIHMYLYTLPLNSNHDKSLTEEGRLVRRCHVLKYVRWQALQAASKS